MRKSIVVTLFLYLIVTSCAGTKYKNQANNRNNPPQNTTKTKDNKISASDLDNVYQEEVDFPIAITNDINLDSDTSLELADEIIEVAMANLGSKYRAGGTTKAGFDCSGLVFTSFKKFDITLPRSSYDMAQYGYKIKDSEAQRGDLIFFITNGGKRINHVGIITEVDKDEIKFVHSSVKLGVIVSSTKESYYKKNFVKIHRVL